MYKACIVECSEVSIAWYTSVEPNGVHVASGDIMTVATAVRAALVSIHASASTSATLIAIHLRSTSDFQYSFWDWWKAFDVVDDIRVGWSYKLLLSKIIGSFDKLGGEKPRLRVDRPLAPSLTDLIDRNIFQSGVMCIPYLHGMAASNSTECPLRARAFSPIQFHMVGGGSLVHRADFGYHGDTVGIDMFLHDRARLHTV